MNVSSRERRKTRSFRRTTPRDVDRICRLYWKEGLSLREVARRTGFTSTTVRNKLREAGAGLRSMSEASKGLRVGPRNGNWNGGVRVSNGYRYVRLKTGGRYVAEHRLVLERKLGRSLRPDEVAHHINGDKADNRPENLKAMTLSQHSRMHGRAWVASGTHPFYVHIPKEQLVSVVRECLATRQSIKRLAEKRLGISYRSFLNKVNRAGLRAWYNSVIKRGPKSA